MNSPRASQLTLEPIYPHGKDILTEKDDFMVNILTKTHEDPPKSTCIIPELVPTIPQTLSMNPSNACHVPDHHTDPLPIIEVSMYMHGMDSLLETCQKQLTWEKIVRRLGP